MSALSSSAAGASLLILLQLASRGVTFAINQVIVRYLSPEIFGLAAQFELYLITVLYFARESVRVASQRQSKDPQTVINLSYISIALGPPLAFGLATVFLSGAHANVPFHGLSQVLYASSCVLELFSEPAFLAAQQKLLYKTRATSEAYATLTRCLVTCAIAVWGNRSGQSFGVLPFALGQVSYAIVLLAMFNWKLWPVASVENFSLLPRRVDQYVPLSFFRIGLMRLVGHYEAQLSIGLACSRSHWLLLEQASWFKTPSSSSSPKAMVC
jgi:O-antigen/teichoic acid export membrane protein